jgi:hypothetical protein
MSSLLQHAKYELRAAGLFDADADYNGDVAVQATSLMEVFAAYGQSGGSAEQTLAVFEKLARGKPLSPLTGEDDEWYVPSGTSGQIQMNKRFASVVKDDEMAWDVRFGRKAITFPYTVN